MEGIWSQRDSREKRTQEEQRDKLRTRIYRSTRICFVSWGRFDPIPRARPVDVKFLPLFLAWSLFNRDCDGLPVCALRDRRRRIPVSCEGFRLKDQDIERCQFATRAQSLGEQEVVVAPRYNNRNFAARRETASGYNQWLCQRTGPCRVGSRHRLFHGHAA